VNATIAHQVVPVDLTAPLLRLQNPASGASPPRLAYIDGAEEWTRETLGRGLARGELEGVSRASRAAMNEGLRLASASRRFPAARVYASRRAVIPPEFGAHDHSISA
jgi:hypothetical protein